MAAFLFRMPAGFPGDVNRTRPCTIEPTVTSSTNPPTSFGQAVVLDATTHGVRLINVSTDSVAPYGITVRPYPSQETSTTAMGAVGFGAGTPALTGIMDVLRSGYINVKVNGATVPVKGGVVYVWHAASSGAHVQGGFEAVSTGGSTITLTNCAFNGPTDADGVTEIMFNI